MEHLATTAIARPGRWRVVVALLVTVIVAYGAFAVVVDTLLVLYPVSLGDDDGPDGPIRSALWGVVAGAVALFIAAGVPGYWLTRRRWMLWPAPLLLGSALAVWGTYGVLNQIGWV